tara:strand:+ start:177 stop:1370 length:1194 start_codon:yes stop_codon:yes gene_type:complete
MTPLKTISNNVSEPKSEKPNVLVIITDQQRADHLGFMGNQVVNTPNLDQLAERSAVFKNTWVSNPVCMPNRCSILTGRMPTAHGVIFNDRSLDWNSNTFVRQFKRADYSTTLIGKSHIQHGASRNSIVPFRGEGAFETPHEEHWWQIYQPPYPEDYHSTTFVTERTIDQIERKSNDNEPWLIWSSFPDPHHPMTPPGRWFEKYRPSEMPLPSSRTDKLDGAPEHLQNFQSIHPKDQRQWVAPCGFGSDELLREAIAATYGMIEMIDNGIGKILKSLEDTQQLDNTIIVFTSDHGDMMGDHGLFLKGFMHYRGTLQVPLLVRAPGIEAQENHELASSIDIGPTLLELCELPFYEGIQGETLVPILLGDKKSVRDCVLIEDDIATVTHVNQSSRSSCSI